MWSVQRNGKAARVTRTTNIQKGIGHVRVLICVNQILFHYTLIQTFLNQCCC